MTVEEGRVYKASDTLLICKNRMTYGVVTCVDAGGALKEVEVEEGG
jgi:hypothetical protein